LRALFQVFDAIQGKGMYTRVLKQALIIASYGVLAVAVGLVSPEFAPAMAPPASWIAAGVVFLGGALAHEAHVRATQRATLAGQICALRSENAALSEQAINFREVLEELDENVSELDAEGSDKSNHDLDRVVSEVRVLQNLIGQLSAIRSTARSTAAISSRPGEAKAKADAETPALGEAQPRGDGSVYGLDENEVLDIVREGLRNERVDLYLQPIVSLPQRKTRFYECFSRIRAEDGVVIRPDQYIELAKQEGLMGAIDNMLLFRCVQLFRKVQGKSTKIGFFCNISANTLTDRKFFPISSISWLPIRASRAISFSSFLKRILIRTARKSANMPRGWASLALVSLSTRWWI
jgi:cyclic-di-GMP phosphodiesterase TipF (flagellum assembly factor)